MRRRELITLFGGAAAAAWPMGARGRHRPTSKIWRIGLLIRERRLDVVRQALRNLGRVEGQNIVLEFRPADRPDQLPTLAAELVSQKVDVIIAGGSQAIRAAKQATGDIPIVMAVSSDPIGTGLVASLARPGGNITGLSGLTPELSGKRLELLREVIPTVTRVAVLWDPDDPPAARSLKETLVAADTLGMAIHAVEVRKPDDFQVALSSAIQALVILASIITIVHAGQIAALARDSGLPAIATGIEFPKSGGLMSYGPTLDDMYRRAAVYVDKILKGAVPADLPVEQPTKFELIINLHAAKAIGLTVPPLLLARADEVIE